MLMSCALAARMNSWMPVLFKFRKVRGQLLLWSAAAVTLQRRWRNHMHGVVKIRKEKAANVIKKGFKNYQFKMRARNKHRAAPVIATFLRELVRSMKDVRYHMKVFLKRCCLIQRVWRKVRSMSEVYYLQVLEAWNKVRSPMVVNVLDAIICIGEGR